MWNVHKFLGQKVFETKEACRGVGHTKAIAVFARDLASKAGADVCLLSTVDAGAYWLQQGFVSEGDSSLNEEFNCFSDTKLMRMPSNQCGFTGEVVRDRGARTSRVRV